MDDEFEHAATALGDSLKRTCHGLGLDVTMAAERHVCERIVHHWSSGMGNAPVLLCGELLFPQRYRPTSNADLWVVRRYTEAELHRGMTIICHLLRAEGIELTAVKPIRELEPGTGVPLTRLAFESACGNIRANSHIDLSLAAGPDAMPDANDVSTTDFPSMMLKGPSYRALAQPWETAVAEKWLAIVNQDPTDLRAKHAVDLVMLSAQTLDIDKVATELMRVCRHRGIDQRALVRTPVALSWSEMARREASWTEECCKRRLQMSLDQGFVDLHGQWQALMAAVELRQRKERLFAHYPSRQIQRRAARDIDFGRVVASDYGDNIVAFRPR